VTINYVHTAVIHASVGILSGISTDFSYFKVNRMDMVMRIEYARNRNRLTTDHSCAGVDRDLSACPPILPYKYCIVYSHSHIGVSKADSSVALDCAV
jgi:hypothetical protein